MGNWIDHVSEPNRLVLAWQATDDVGDRQRWAVGEFLRNGDDAVLRYFEKDEFEAYNFGQPFAKILSYGYRGYAAFPLSVTTHERGVVEAFMRRLPPRHRPDFDRYKQHLRLRPETPISDFALLGLSEAQLPSDGFSVVDPLDPAVDQVELLNELAGYRYYLKDHPAPELGCPIQLEAEQNNPFDANAVAAMLNGAKIGNINRLQAPTFRKWIEDGRVTASIDRINGTAQRPRVFAFVRVTPRP